MTATSTAAPSFTPPVGVSYDMKTGRAVTLAMPIYDTGKDDPELGLQWQLGYLGDMVRIWADFTGKGVRVAPLDSGTQSTHWDLAPQYDASNSLRVDGQILPGDVNVSDHGTAVAGLMAAARNGRGGVGVAYDARLTAVNVFEWTPANLDGSDFWKALQAAGQQYDVINN